MRLNLALFKAFFTAKYAQSAKLGRLLRLYSCATNGFCICVHHAEILRFLDFVESQLSILKLIMQNGCLSL